MRGSTRVLLADFARTVSLRRLLLDKIQVDDELRKGVEFGVGGVAEDVAVDFRFLCGGGVSDVGRDESKSVRVGRLTRAFGLCPPRWQGQMV